jgi:two-component system cell cycle sensor histidine kinase/response regulator CckA
MSVRRVKRWQDVGAVDAAALALSLAFFAWMFLGRGEDARTHEIIDSLFFVPPGAAVAWVSWQVARRWTVDQATRRAWWLIAASHLLYWAGGSAWTIAIFFAPSLGASKLADAFSFPSYPLYIWAVLSFPGIYRDSRSRVRFLLDAALVIVATSVLSWYFGYRTLGAASSAPTDALYFAMVFPAADLAMLLLTGAAWLGASHPTTRRALAWLAVSKGVLLVTDYLFGAVRLTGEYHPGQWLDAGWFAGWILAWVAARLVVRRIDSGRAAGEAETHREYHGAISPFVFVVAAQLLLLWVVRGRRGESIGTVALAASALIVLVILRHATELRENRRMFERSRSREARFRALVQYGSDVVLVVAADGAVLYSSPSAERLRSRRTAGNDDGQLAKFVGTDAAAALARLMGGLQSHEIGGPVPLRVPTTDGAPVDLEFLATDLRGDESVGGIVLTGRDVTERRRLEGDVLHTQKVRAIGQMAGGVAHDFNNILTALRGHADLLLAELPANSASRQDAVDIAYAADRAAAVTRQLLQFSQREVARPESLDLNAVTAALRPMLVQLVPGTIDLSVVGTRSPCPVFIDRSQLEQIALNLVVNARDAMPDGGVLEVRTRSLALSPADAAAAGLPPGDYVALDVRDDGIGMDAATRAQIFVPFFTTKPKDRGTGIGLATVQTIAAAAGGTVQVTTAPGSGSTFTVLFPRAAEAAPALPAAIPGPSPLGEGARILVVDDEEAVLRVTARLLQRRDYRVSMARNGVEALEILARADSRIDLVLTDLMMPRMGGAELLTHVTERYPGMPVICVSGHADDEHSRRQAASGADAYLAKPYPAEELYATISTVLARRAVVAVAPTARASSAPPAA